MRAYLDELDRRLAPIRLRLAGMRQHAAAAETEQERTARWFDMIEEGLGWMNRHGKAMARDLRSNDLLQLHNVQPLGFDPIQWEELATVLGCDPSLSNTAIGREQIARAAVRRNLEQQTTRPTATPSVTAEERAVLACLCESPSQLKLNWQIIKMLMMGKNTLSEGTVKECVRKLIAKGLAVRPDGTKRKGATATPAGQAVIREGGGKT